MEKKEQISNSIAYLVPVVAGNILSIIALAVFTRFLTVQDFGYLALAQIYATLLVGISNLGLLSVYNRNFFEQREREAAGALLYSILAFVSATTALIAAITWFQQDSLSKVFTGTMENGPLLFWAFSAGAVQNLKTYLMRYLRNAERVRDFVLYTISDAACSVAISIILLTFCRAGIIAIVIGPLISGALFLVILLRNFSSFLPLRFERRILAQSVKLAYPLTPIALFGLLRTQFDKYMIGLLATVGGVGLYSIAQRITNVTFMYMTAVQNVFMPNVYKQMFAKGAAAGADIGRYLTPFAWTCSGVALCVAMLSEEALIILTPESYHGAVSVSVILSMYYASLFFGKQPQLIFAKKTHIASALVLFGVVVNIAFNIPFILKWGAEGAAWATLLSGVVSGGVTFAVSQYYYRIKWEYRNLGLIFGTLTCACLILIIQLHFDLSYVWRLPVKLFAFMAYFWIGIRLKIITRQNIAIFWDVVRSIASFSFLKTKDA